MADLTNIKNDIIIVCPDPKTMTAFVEWQAALKSGERANLSVVENTYIVSAPDPLGTLDVIRKEFIKLVDDNAESPTSVVRLQFTGTTFSSVAMLVAKPPELIE